MRRGERSTRPALLIAAIGLLLAGSARGGAFMFANATNGVSVVTHPSGYTGAGGVLTVTVCIDPAAANAASMVVPTENVVRTYNARRVASRNLRTGGNNDVPSSAYDWESMFLHEMGHCVGIAHPHLGTESFLSQPSSEYVRATQGPDAAWDLNDGADNVIGTPDDLRDDDVNLNWFRKGVNQPFAALPAAIDASNWSRNLADLPGGHSFASGASSEVADALGYTDLEAVMHQVQTNDEAQRELTADDWAMLRYAESGLDSTAGNADDYTLQLDYVGQTTACDVVIHSETSGFGRCSIGGTFLNATHIAINNTNPVPPKGIFYNSNYNWYFNQHSNEGSLAPQVPGLHGPSLALAALLLGGVGGAALRWQRRRAGAQAGVVR